MRKLKKWFNINSYKFINLLKNYKETTVFALVAVVILIVVIAFGINHEGFALNTNKDAVTASAVKKENNAYKVIIEDKEIGVVFDRNIANEALAKAKEELNKNASKKYEISDNITFEPVYAKKDQIISKEDLYNILYKKLVDDLPLYKVEAYVLELQNGTKVALKSLDEIKEVLTKVESKYIPEGNKFIVKDLNIGEDSTVKPKIEKIKEQKTAQHFVGVVNGDRIAKGTSYFVSKQEQSVDESKQGTLTVNKKNNQENDKQKNKVNVIGVDFVENMDVKLSFVKQDDVKSLEEAVAILTNEIEQKKVYTVKAGDCLSVVAEKNDMGLSELLKLNKGLTEKSILQIGQKLTISVPVPKLSVKTKERIVYRTAVPKSVKYKKDSTEYKNYKKVIDYGKDGEKEVTANIIKKNGFEEGKEIVNEKIIKEPRPQIIKIGTKPLPPKSATGSFRRPIRGGRMSSGYGHRWGGFHYGMDFAAPIGTPIFASDGGRVIYSQWNSGGYGYLVKIDHGNGFTTYYAHCSKLYVKVGQRVAKGETIAAIGTTGDSTGPHVHFEIRLRGIPINPARYLD